MYTAIIAGGSGTRLWPSSRNSKPKQFHNLYGENSLLQETVRRLDPLVEPGRTYRHSARELLALSAWRNHDFTAARRYIDMMATDAETPAGTRARVEVLSALIAADGKS
jgi:hypothetical protein